MTGHLTSPDAILGLLGVRDRLHASELVVSNALSSGLTFRSDGGELVVPLALTFVLTITSSSTSVRTSTPAPGTGNLGGIKRSLPGPVLLNDGSQVRY